MISRIAIVYSSASTIQTHARLNWKTRNINRIRLGRGLSETKQRYEVGLIPRTNTELITKAGEVEKSFGGINSMSTAVPYTW